MSLLSYRTQGIAGIKADMPGLVHGHVRRHLLQQLALSVELAHEPAPRPGDGTDHEGRLSAHDAEKQLGYGVHVPVTQPLPGTKTEGCHMSFSGLPTQRGALP